MASNRKCFIHTFQVSLSIRANYRLPSMHQNVLERCSRELVVACFYYGGLLLFTGNSCTVLCCQKCDYPISFALLTFVFLLFYHCCLTYKSYVPYSVSLSLSLSLFLYLFVFLFSFSDTLYHLTQRHNQSKHSSWVNITGSRTICSPRLFQSSAR